MRNGLSDLESSTNKGCVPCPAKLSDTNETVSFYTRSVKCHCTVCISEMAGKASAQKFPPGPALQYI